MLSRSPVRQGVGNRTSTVKNAVTTTYAHNNANQLVTETTGNTVKTYSYDANGNETLVETRVNDVLTVTEQTFYDEPNRRLRYVRSNGGGPQEESFTYRGASWHRRTQTASGTTTTFLYDADDVAADFINDAVDTFYVTPFLDENLSLTRSAATAYHTHDHLGSIRTVTDAAGALLNRYAYTAFGEPYAPGTSVTLAQRYIYCRAEAKRNGRKT